MGRCARLTSSATTPVSEFQYRGPARCVRPRNPAASDAPRTVRGDDDDCPHRPGREQNNWPPSAAPSVMASSNCLQIYKSIFRDGRHRCSAIITLIAHLLHLPKPCPPDSPPPSPSDIQRQLTYLQAVVSSMPQGISVFDEGLRLRVWNQGFIDVLGLPNSAVYEGVPFSDLIRIPPPAANMARATSNPMSSASPAWPPVPAPPLRAHPAERGRPWSRASRCILATMSSASSPPIPTSPSARRSKRGCASSTTSCRPSWKAFPERRQPVQPGRGARTVQQRIRASARIPRRNWYWPGTDREMFRFNAERGEYGQATRTRSPALMQRIATPTRHI